jgi:hypothetical protein
MVLRHEPEQSVSLAAQPVAQAPATQALPLQLMPQAPQLLGSLVVSTQAPLHVV